MIRTSTTVRRYLDGHIVGALVQHVDGRRHALTPDCNGRWSPGNGDQHDALRLVAEDLEAAYGSLPAPIVDRAAWLSAVVLDARTTAQAKRLAALVAKLRPGQWLGVHAVADALNMDYRNTPRCVGLLVRLGFITKSRAGHRVLYEATLPGGAL